MDSHKTHDFIPHTPLSLVCSTHFSVRESGNHDDKVFKSRTIRPFHRMLTQLIASSSGNRKPVSYKASKSGTKFSLSIKKQATDASTMIVEDAKVQIVQVCAGGSPEGDHLLMKVHDEFRKVFDLG